MNYPVWLTGFACGLLAVVTLNVLIHDPGLGVAFGFGLLLLTWWFTPPPTPSPQGEGELGRAICLS